MNIRVVCDEKCVEAIVPDHYNLQAKKAAFDLIRDAFLRPEIEADLKTRITEAGLDYDEIVAQNRAAGR